MGPRTVIIVGVVSFGVWVQPSCACSTKVPAYRTAMKSDLRNLATAQEWYFGEHGVFASAFADSFFVPTTGVTAPTIMLTPDGYTAWVGHDLTDITCSIFIGSMRLGPAESEGYPECTDAKGE